MHCNHCELLELNKCYPPPDPETCVVAAGYDPQAPGCGSGPNGDMNFMDYDI